jgi:hypothetical protein
VQHPLFKSPLQYDFNEDGQGHGKNRPSAFVFLHDNQDPPYSVTIDSGIFYASTGTESGQEKRK